MLIQRQKTIVSVNLVHWLKNNIVISKCKHAYSPGCVTLNAQYRMRSTECAVQYWRNYPNMVLLEKMVQPQKRICPDKMVQLTKMVNLVKIVQLVEMVRPVKIIEPKPDKMV